MKNTEKMQLYEKICPYFVFEESTESIIIRKDAPAEIHEYFVSIKKFWTSNLDYNKVITMNNINWEKAEWAENIKITFKDGSEIMCSGAGLETADEFDDPDEKFDTFFVDTKSGGLALDVSEIKSIDFCN